MNPDLQFIRHYFPALQDGFVYMDNAGGSQTAKPVVDRISQYLLTSDVQLGASYPTSQLAGARVDEAARGMAAFVNAAHAEEVVMGPSTTMVLKILSLCMARGWSQGDEVIVTNSDHEANISPWRALADQGIVVKTWKLNPQTLTLDLEDLQALMGPKTKLVAFTHASNILGTVNPVKEITRFVHQRGALVCVDGVAYAPHRAIDVQDWDVDFYAFSFYKVYGPHYAMLYGKKELLEALPGFNLSFIKSTPYKFQPGNVNYELSYGMLGVLDYLQALAAHHAPDQPANSLRASVVRAFELMEAQEAVIGNRFLAFLREHPGVTIIGKRDMDGARVPTISFVANGRNSEEVVTAVDPHGIGIRFGDFYAVDLVKDHDLEQYNGVIRVSMVHYNTLEEADRLIQVLKDVL